MCSSLLLNASGYEIKISPYSNLFTAGRSNFKFQVQ